VVTADCTRGDARALRSDREVDADRSGRSRRRDKRRPIARSPGAAREDRVDLRRGMYGQLRKARAADCLVLPTGIKPEEAASAFVNPLTALGMLETARREGHKGLVHTAAASNLGQILNRLCQADGIPLVNIVRSAEQVQI